MKLKNHKPTRDELLKQREEHLSTVKQLMDYMQREIDVFEKFLWTPEGGVLSGYEIDRKIDSLRNIRRNSISLKMHSALSEALEEVEALKDVTMALIENDIEEGYQPIANW